MIAMPLLWGQALALLVGNHFEWSAFIAVHLFGLLCQVYILYLNDVADEDVDRAGTGTWLSGGSGVIARGLLNGAQLFRAALLALAGMALVSLVCAVVLDRPWMLLLSTLAAVAGWTYSLAPLKSSYRGGGGLHQALSCGVLLPLIAFYLQAGSLAAFPWLLLLPFSLIFYAAHLVTALPDMTADRGAGKRSFPVRHGEPATVRCVVLVLCVAYASAVPLSAVWLANLWTLAAVSGLAFAILLITAPSVHNPARIAENAGERMRFASAVSASQAWMLVAWTGVLFWHGLHRHPPLQG
ncbi:MAG: prenyltransferase [Panacagrimonas sp.]